MAQPAQLREALLRAVDEGLLVPGDIVRAAIYEHLEKSYKVKREEIPEKLETFHEALRNLLGAGSSKVMEKLIVRSIYSRLELKFTQHDGWTLVDYVSHAKEVRRDG